LLTFVVAASGVTIAGLGSPLWAVLAGGSVSWLLKARPKSTPALKPVTQNKN